MFKFASLVLAVSWAICMVNAQETHVVHFVNNCGFGTPTLVAPGGTILSTGADHVHTGSPLDGIIAYLQTGSCGLNGEGCTLVEASLSNAGSSVADISLVPPHKFSVTSGFGFFNGCDGAGADCTNPNCGNPSVGCNAPNVDIAITFCD